MATTKVDVNLLGATGTPGSGTFLRGDGTWNAPDGGWEEVSSTTASASATVDFTGLADGYDYKVEIIKSLPATDNTPLRMRFGTGGTPTYLTSAYLSRYGFIFTDTTAGASTDTVGFRISSHQGNATGEWLNGVVDIFDPGSAAIHLIRAMTDAKDNAANNELVYTPSIQTGTTAVTALRFMYESGNIASGLFKLLRIGRS